MQKLGMKQVPGVGRVTIKKSKNVRRWPGREMGGDRDRRPYRRWFPTH